MGDRFLNCERVTVNDKPDSLRNVCMEVLNRRSEEKSGTCQLLWDERKQKCVRVHINISMHI